MATYVNDLRLKEIATGDESGTWGTSTNTNLELIAEAFSFGTEAITTNADTHTTTIADGSTDPGRSIYLKYTGTLDSACTITIGPNTVSKLWFIENGTSGSQNIIISQGSGANVTVPAGEVKAIYSDGAGSGAAMVDAFANLKVSDAAQTNITSLGTLTTLTVDDITIDGSTISDSGDLTLDVGGDIILDADGSTISMKDGGTNRITFNLDSTPDLVLAGGNASITASTSDADLSFIGNDGGSDVTALTLDMSENGHATFRAGATFNESSLDSDFRVESNGQTHALFVDGGLNNVGIGYSAKPTATLQGLNILSGDGNGGIQLNKEDGSNPSDGETLGSYAWKGQDGANSNAAAEASIVAIAAEDHSGSTAATSMAFNTKPTGTGPGSAPTERMRIDSAGNVGIGTDSPTVPLQINHGSSTVALYTLGGFNYQAKFESSDAEAAIVIEDSNSTNDGNRIGVITDDMAFTTAGSERVRIDSSGNVGIGVSSIANNLHIGIDSGGEGILVKSTGDHSGLLQFNVNRSNSNRVLGQLLGTWNGTDVADIQLKTADDTTNKDNGQITFSTSSADNIAERMRLDDAGNLMIGTTSLEGTGGFTFVKGTNGFTTTNNTTSGATAGYEYYTFRRNTTQIGSITMSGTTNINFNTSSDARLKEVTGKARGLEVIKKLNPVSYDWKEDGKADEGLIAQEVEKLVPNAVAISEDGYYSMDYSKLVTPLIAAIQEQQEQIDALQSEINILKGE